MLSQQNQNIPNSIQNLARYQIKEQFKKEHPSIRFEFEDPSCDQKGTYFFSDTEVHLEANHTVWPGIHTYRIADVVEGKKLDFPVKGEQSNLVTLVSPLEKENSKQGKNYISSFLGGAAIGAVGGGVAGYSLSPNAQSKNLNLIVFGLSGALTGGLLGLFKEELTW
jgi:hypothetical protein